MTTATTGAGTITLGSAVFGYLTFALAGVADGDVISYAINDGANSEIGTGTYTAAGTTLTRTPTKSTNSNAAISLSGSAQVFITPRAEDLPGLDLANTFTQAQTAPKFNASASSVSGGQFDITGVADVSIANTASATVTPSVGSTCGFVITLIETALTGVIGVFVCPGGNQPSVVFSSSANLVSGVNIAAKVSLGWDGTQFTLYNNSGAGTLVFRLKTERMY